MEALLDTHRYLGKIDEGIKKGNPLFYLYGKGINDYALFDVHLGVKEIETSLFLYFYNVQKVDAFVVVRNNKVTFLNKNGQEVSTSKALNIEKKSTGFGADKSADKDSDSKDEKAKEVTAGMGNFENDLKYIEDSYDTKKIAIYFDAFEWETGLYGAEQKLELLQRVRNWNKSKKSFTVVSIKEPELLKSYGYDIDEETADMVYLGNPSQIEIAKAYRRYVYMNRPDIKVDEDDFTYIVSAMQGSKKNLRESIRVLKQVLSLLEIGSVLTKELFEKSISKTIEEKVTFDDVIINERDKEQILQAVRTFHHDKNNSSKGMILYGPPGTGKTYIAKAIAHEYSMNFMSPSLADLKGEYIGQTSGKVKRLFEEARANAPTIIFLDEIDTLFTKRGGADSDSYLADMVNQFLVEIDGAKTGKQDIFIIGATNRLEVIDLAIRSRLSNEFFINVPNAINREGMFDAKFKVFKLSEQTWKNEFIERTEGMSGRDIDNFVKNIKALGIDEKEITQTIFNTALKTLEISFINDFKRDLDGSIVIEDKVKIKFDDVIGYEDVKRTLQMELKYILSTFEEKKKMKEYSIKPKRGNLLYGPPGNGKTTFAEALAGEHEFYYIKILSKDFQGYSSVNMLKKLELIFSNTIKLSKMTNKKGVVLFFDEVDTLIQAGVMDSIVRGTLLNFLEDREGIKSENSKIILIAATNFKEYLDEASIREGRFDSKLEIGYPPKEDAIEMIKKFFEMDSSLDVSSVKDEYYIGLYERLESEKKEEIEKENLKIKDERFHKIFEGIATVDLQGIKEKIKTEAYYSRKINDGRIVI